MRERVMMIGSALAMMAIACCVGVVAIEGVEQVLRCYAGGQC